MNQLSARAWESGVLYQVGEVVSYEGKLYRVICPHHPDCDGELRSGFIPPPGCIEDGIGYYVEVGQVVPENGPSDPVEGQ